MCCAACAAVQSLKSKVEDNSDARLQTLDPRPISYTPPHLAERILAARAALEARGAPEGERKTITALFADLAGFTALARDLDPEVTRHIIDPALRLMMNAVHRYEGYVAQSLGDGIFALFGAPIAHEDHPQRAVYAALRMQEDLHWLDAETQAFLSLLSESVASARILLLVNYRPEYRHEWGNKTYYTQLRLDPLGKEEAGDLLTVLLGADPALQSLKQLILAKTEGNPFFTEEIAQALVDQGMLVRDSVGARLRPGSSSIGHAPLPTDLHIPATVQAVLASRIDRLPAEEKDLLQTLAVIGKEFSLGLLKQAVDQSEDALQSRLSHLQTAEFIYEQPAFPEPEYTLLPVARVRSCWNCER